MDEDDDMEHAHGATAVIGGADENPDLFYRLKLKLWNRDRMTNAIRTPFDRQPEPRHDVAHWKNHTRVVITEPGDIHTGKVGRIVEYRGKGWYAVLMDDGHKVTFSPMHWERVADQSDQRYPPPPVDTYRTAHRAVESSDGKQSAARDSSPAQAGTPFTGKSAGAGNLSARGNKAGEGDSAQSAASLSNPPPGTRVRIIRTYGGQMLSKDEVRTGETQTFAHGWYYITLDDSGKKESCRRNSFVVVGDDEDIALGFFEGGSSGDAAPRSRKGGHDGPAASERDGGEGSARYKDADEEGEKEPLRSGTSKKRGRKPKERVEESESDDDDSDDDDGDSRKKGKKIKESRESREEEEARIKREKEDARRQREKEQEEREREKERQKERERERQREEEAKAEASMTQEERDALEAARLAAMLNRNPRRRGGGDVPPAGMLPRIPIKKHKEKRDRKEGDDAGKT